MVFSRNLNAKQFHKLDIFLKWNGKGQGVLENRSPWLWVCFHFAVGERKNKELFFPP